MNLYTLSIIMQKQTQMVHCPNRKQCQVHFCRGDQGLILYNNAINYLDDGIECMLIKSANNTMLEATMCTLEDEIRIQNDPDKLQERYEKNRMLLNRRKSEALLLEGILNSTNTGCGSSSLFVLCRTRSRGNRGSQAEQESATSCCSNKSKQRWHFYFQRCSLQDM